MIKQLPKNIVSFFVVIFAQVAFFNNIELGGFINPYIYVIFILLLPFETPGWATLILGFFLGLSIDIFSETLGLHTSATVLLAYLRIHVLSVISPHDGYEKGTYPRVAYYGLLWFIKYATILVLAHHTFLFFLEIFRFQDILAILLRIFLSSIFTITFITLSQYFVFRK